MPVGFSWIFTEICDLCIFFLLFLHGTGVMVFRDPRRRL
jgi:hypothetical protein